jgi:hypothetical protein
MSLTIFESRPFFQANIFGMEWILQLDPNSIQKYQKYALELFLNYDSDIHMYYCITARFERIDH